MTVLPALLIGLHIIGSLLWVASVICIVFIFSPVWEKYRDYVYQNNFRTEIILRWLKFMHLCLSISVISGVGLIGVNHRQALIGFYGFFFSLKMLMLISIFFLIQPYLRLAVSDDENILKLPQPSTRYEIYTLRSIAILLLSAALVADSLFLKTN